MKRKAASKSMTYTLRTMPSTLPYLRDGGELLRHPREPAAPPELRHIPQPVVGRPLRAILHVAPRVQAVVVKLARAQHAVEDDDLALLRAHREPALAVEKVVRLREAAGAREARLSALGHLGEVEEDGRQPVAREVARLLRRALAVVARVEEVVV